MVYIPTKNNDCELYTSGYKNRELRIPKEPQAIFKIASVGILYKAVAIAKLARADKLSLDSSLEYYLPELAKELKILIRLLLNVRSVQKWNSQIYGHLIVGLKLKRPMRKSLIWY